MWWLDIRCLGYAYATRSNHGYFDVIPSVIVFQRLRQNIQTNDVSYPYELEYLISNHLALLPLPPHTVVNVEETCTNK